MNVRKIKVLLADDHSLVRLGFAALLKYQRDMTVVGDAADGKEALRLAEATRPDVVVMDLVMPNVDGVEATRLIREALPDTKVLILTTFGTSADISRALDAGASGAIVKDAANEELTDAIRAVAAGGTAFSPEIARELEECDIRTLTPRQLELLASVVRGLSNREIAAQFAISADSVKQQLNVVFSKLHAANRTEAVAIALRKQLLRI